jgi:sugar phosphate isomerase/epimerase
MEERKIPLGASTLGYRFDSLDVALREIAGQGFDLVDLAMIPSYCPHFNPVTATENAQEALQEQLEDLGLRVATLNVSHGLFGNPAARDAQMAFVRASLRLAQRLGAYGVTTQSGVEPPPGQWREVADAVAPDVRTLGDEARALGLELTLELHKSMVMATGQEAVNLMSLVDHSQVGVAIDPSHATYAGENVADIARALGDRVKHVHLRDALGKNIMVVPGDGTVDFTELARALREIEYDRATVIELEYGDARAPEVSPDLARAKTFLEESFATAW